MRLALHALCSGLAEIVWKALQRNDISAFEGGFIIMDLQCGLEMSILI